MNVKGSNKKLGMMALLVIVLAILKSKEIISISWLLVLSPLIVYFVCVTIWLIRLFIKEMGW